MQGTCAILLSVACLALQYFSTLSHKWHEFWKQLLDTKCVLILSTTSVWNISHSIKKYEISSKIYIGLHIKYLSLLSDFKETWISSKDCPKILKYKISWKSVQWKHNCSMWMGRQTWQSYLLFAILRMGLQMCSNMYFINQPTVA